LLPSSSSCASRNPYAAAYRSGNGPPPSCITRRWLWVPAFAGRRDYSVRALHRSAKLRPSPAVRELSRYQRRLDVAPGTTAPCAMSLFSLPSAEPDRQRARLQLAAAGISFPHTVSAFDVEHLAARKARLPRMRRRRGKKSCGCGGGWGGGGSSIGGVGRLLAAALPIAPKLQLEPIRCDRA